MPTDLDTIAPPVDGAALRDGDVVWLRSGGPPMTVEDPDPDLNGEIGLVFFECDHDCRILTQVRLRPILLTRFGS